jgi:hypothetical protein
MPRCLCGHGCPRSRLRNSRAPHGIEHEDQRRSERDANQFVAMGYAACADPVMRSSSVKKPAEQGMKDIRRATTTTFFS